MNRKHTSYYCFHIPTKTVHRGQFLMTAGAELNDREANTMLEKWNHQGTSHGWYYSLWMIPGYRLEGKAIEMA